MNRKIKREKDELKNFSVLGVGAFDFWNNKEDDIYGEFYKNMPLEKKLAYLSHQLSDSPPRGGPGGESIAN